eukprot:COSAG03_NODE_209_length_10610_cov_3.098088_3_plen_199_part_00
MLARGGCPGVAGGGGAREKELSRESPCCLLDKQPLQVLRCPFQGTTVSYSGSPVFHSTRYPRSWTTFSTWARSQPLLPALIAAVRDASTSSPGANCSSHFSLETSVTKLLFVGRISYRQTRALQPLAKNPLTPPLWINEPGPPQHLGACTLLASMGKTAFKRKGHNAANFTSLSLKFTSIFLSCGLSPATTPEGLKLR